jgi:hypothetical protein
MQGNQKRDKQVCVLDMHNSMLDGGIDVHHYNSCCVAVKTTACGINMLINQNRQRFRHRHSLFTITRGAAIFNLLLFLKIIN